MPWNSPLPPPQDMSKEVKFWNLGVVEVVNKASEACFVFKYNGHLYDWYSQTNVYLQSNTMYTITVDTTDKADGAFDGDVFLTSSCWYGTLDEVQLLDKDGKVRGGGAGGEEGEGWTGPEAR